jgi:hypothetical protein
MPAARFPQSDVSPLPKREQPKGKGRQAQPDKNVIKNIMKKDAKGIGLCRDWNEGRCKRNIKGSKDKCTRTHACHFCLKTSHTGPNCKESGKYY